MTIPVSNPIQQTCLRRTYLFAVLGWLKLTALTISALVPFLNVAAETMTAVDQMPFVTQVAPPSSPTASSISSVQITSSYLPGWRPPPDLLILPASPFAVAGAITMVPKLYEQETRALAERIRGVVHMGSGYTLFMDYQLVRQGAQVPLTPRLPAATSSAMPTASKSRSIGPASRPTQPVMGKESATGRGTDSEPTKEIFLVFKGINDDHTHAIFKLDQVDINVPLPSAQRELGQFNGSIEKMKRVAPAFLLGYEGYFITSAEQVSDPGISQKIKVKTQAGFFSAVILKKNMQTQLALGRIDPVQDLPLPIWDLPEDPMGSNSFAFAFDPKNTASFARPQPVIIEKTEGNPRWLVGAPLFENKRLVGILGAKNQRLTLYTYNELMRMFPELIDANRDARLKAQTAAHAEAANQMAATEGVPSPKKALFNPEQYIGAVCIYLSSDLKDTATAVP